MKEKRILIRFNISLKVSYIVNREPRMEKIGTSRDVSAHGIQLLTNDRLVIGDKLDMRISVPEALNPAHIKGTVVWSRESDSPKAYAYSAGVDFDKIEEDNKNTFLKFLCNLMHPKEEDKKEE